MLMPYGCPLLKRIPLGPPCWSQSCWFSMPTQQKPSSGSFCPPTDVPSLTQSLTSSRCCSEISVTSERAPILQDRAWSSHVVVEATWPGGDRVTSWVTDPEWSPSLHLEGHHGSFWCRGFPSRSQTVPPFSVFSLGQNLTSSFSAFVACYPPGLGP